VEDTYMIGNQSAPAKGATPPVDDSCDVPPFPPYPGPGPELLAAWRAELDRWTAETLKRSRDAVWLERYLALRGAHPALAGHLVRGEADYRSRPAKGQIGSRGDLALMRDLRLSRPPFHLDRDERSRLLLQLLDLHLTIQRYPEFGEQVRLILRGILGEGSEPASADAEDAEGGEEQSCAA
jgi:hypothetical protein